MLASALATEPRVLLLDEPAAGASAVELERLADLLRSLRDRGLGLLVIEHNLRFVRRVADVVTVLEAGRASPPARSRRSRRTRSCASRVPGPPVSLACRS